MKRMGSGGAGAALAAAGRNSAQATREIRRRQVFMANSSIQGWRMWTKDGAEDRAFDRPGERGSTVNYGCRRSKQGCKGSCG
jgi:glycine/D-amino acid oxidase-like deaminating enzyme